MDRHSPEMRKFFEGCIYSEKVFFIDKVVHLDASAKEIMAVARTDRELPFSREQRGDPERHPRHVAGPELIMITGNLGFLHAYFFHGCRWEDGWVGFGNRIHRADFRRLALLGPPLELRSRETRTRVGAKRVMMRFEFEFKQGGQIVYEGDQSALFFRGLDILDSEAPLSSEN
jgi:hypothetical protein